MLTIFQDQSGVSQHDAFQTWRRVYPNGVFLALRTARSALLHGSQCQHLGTLAGHGAPDSLTKKRKVCAASESALLEWAQTSGVRVVPCSHCLRDGLISFLSGQLAPLAEEVTSTLGILEGARTTIVVNAYERDPKARNRCIKKWGLACVACGFDFLRHYGILGEGFIHVHHLVPLSTIGAEYELNPEQDLRPVCPNCHAMLHRQIPPLTIEQLSALLLERPA